MLSGLEIKDALASLDRALALRGVKGEICLFGGVVMVLAFQARQSTRDVDAIFAPAASIRELAADVGRERGWQEDWLNIVTGCHSSEDTILCRSRFRRVEE